MRCSIYQPCLHGVNVYETVNSAVQPRLSRRRESGGGSSNEDPPYRDAVFTRRFEAELRYWYMLHPMSTDTVRLHRWDEIALEKVTEMLSRKIVTGEREMIAQIYLKRGCQVPMHSHESEQMTYILQGALKFLIGGEEITVREGEVLHIPSWVEHQAEALDDTFELDVFSPIRRDWLDHTDDYFQR